MERIQSALEKARSRREGTPEGKSSRPERTTRQRRARQDKVDAAWDALPSFEPQRKLLTRNHVFAVERGDLSSHVDLLRTRALLAMRDNDWTRLAITSPNVGCGKTTTALNLAYSLARQQERRVLLIEMDLRKPGLLKLIGRKENQPQFSRVLEEREPAERHLFRLTPNLAIGANRTKALHPSELLQSSSLKRVLDSLEEEYQPSVMIFDMPPILVSDDVMGFADNVDCVLLMAGAGSTTIQQIDSCERDLSERTNVLGVVLNKCRYMGKDTSYDYYE